MEPREIKASEVRVGDTIRITVDIKVNNLDEKDDFITANWDSWRLDAFNTITLLNRPLPPHKYKVGQKVIRQYQQPPCTCVLKIEAIRGHNHDGCPLYLLPGCEHHVACHWTENQISLVVEPAWEPKWGEFVKWCGGKYIYISFHCDLQWPYKITSEKGFETYVPLSELSKWEGDA